jgi:hypothetical protein
MALDILSVAPMSTEVERLFSAADRSRLEANTIGITQTLRSWLRGGYINTEDMLINVPDDDENVITIQEARARAEITTSPRG